MFYKGIIFDLDNTLYNYDTCHNNSLKEVFLFINENTGINVDLLIEEYEEARMYFKNDLKNTASSHNKMIHFKRLIEKLNINMSLLNKINELYWSVFLNNIKCFDFVEEFIKWNKNLNIKIGILTDYQLEYQIIKLEKLGLLEYIDNFLTSEEIGIEKPSNYGFLSLLNKMNLKYNEVIMIGDNYEKDINGSNQINIKSYHFDKSNNFYKILLDNYSHIHKQLINLKNISLYCGERYDLVQAGGGNISIKVNDIYDESIMFIKSSGIQLSNVNEKNGYSIINNNKLLNDIKNDNICDVVKYNYFGNNRSSIETYMHSFLKKYTVHLHPIQINKVLISNESERISKMLCPDSLIIDYYTPGLKLSNAIFKKYNGENIIFLINHGIIFTSDNYEQIYEIIEKTIHVFEKFLNIDLEFMIYKYTNYISNIINNIYNCSNITYLSQNRIIKKYINDKFNFDYDVSFPDCLIYCGNRVCFDIHELEINKEKPSIIFHKNEIYINSHSLNKCKEIEEVLIANLLILDTVFSKKYLLDDELKYLSNWDAETYRKNI